MAWLKKAWKPILLIIASSIISMTGDRAVSHRVSKVVVEVLPLIPDDLGETPVPALPSPAEVAKPQP